MNAYIVVLGLNIDLIPSMAAACVINYGGVTFSWIRRQWGVRSPLL